MTKKRKPKTVTTRSFGALMWLSLSFYAATAGATGPAIPDGKYDKPYALIFGTVWGPDARPVYGVKIRIRRDNEKKPRWELYSNHSGEFAQRVPAAKADYLIWAELKGNKSPGGVPLHPGEEVTVHVEYDEKVTIGLHLQ